MQSLPDVPGSAFAVRRAGQHRVDPGQPDGLGADHRVLDPVFDRDPLQPGLVADSRDRGPDLHRLTPVGPLRERDAAEVDGIVLRRGRIEAFTQAISPVRDGARVISPEVQALLAAPDDTAELTLREGPIPSLVAQGFSTATSRSGRASAPGRSTITAPT